MTNNYFLNPLIKSEYDFVIRTRFVHSSRAANAKEEPRRLGNGSPNPHSPSMPSGLLWVWIKFRCRVPSLLSHHHPLTQTHKNSIAELEELVAASSFTEWQITEDWRAWKTCSCKVSCLLLLILNFIKVWQREVRLYATSGSLMTTTTLTSGPDRKWCSYHQRLFRYNPSIASTWCPVLLLPAKLFFSLSSLILQQSQQQCKTLLIWGQAEILITVPDDHRH